MLIAKSELMKKDRNANTRNWIIGKNGLKNKESYWKKGLKRKSSSHLKHMFAVHEMSCIPK